MLNVAVVKSSHDLCDRISFTDVAKEGITHTFTFVRAFYNACGFELDSIVSQGWPDGLDKGIYVLRLPLAEKGQ